MQILPIFAGFPISITGGYFIITSGFIESWIYTQQAMIYMITKKAGTGGQDLQNYLSLLCKFRYFSEFLDSLHFSFGCD